MKPGSLCAYAGVLWATAALAAPPQPTASSRPAYAVEIVAAEAVGKALRSGRIVVSQRRRQPDCAPSPMCLPFTETTVWTGDRLFVLQGLPGRPRIEASGVNAAGWVVGSAWRSDPHTDSRAVAWKPGADGYETIDLGLLPGTTHSRAIGIDARNRVVGDARTSSFPPRGAPFMWTQDGGITDLSLLGFPDEAPLAISPGGNVASASTSYRLDRPGEFTRLPPPPAGFRVPGNNPAAINDAGDQARLLSRASSSNLLYLFRLHGDEASWQQLAALGAGELAPFDIGSINSAGDITATLGGVGVIAYGPAGTALRLSDRLSPAYVRSAIARAGPVDDAGEILAVAVIGQSQRLVRLAPLRDCGSACLRVSSLRMEGRFLHDALDPGRCSAKAATRVRATLTLNESRSRPAAGASIAGRFLDDAGLDVRVLRAADSSGTVSFTHEGRACAGAVAFFVDAASDSGLILDRAGGTLTGALVPRP